MLELSSPLYDVVSFKISPRPQRVTGMNVIIHKEFSYDTGALCCTRYGLLLLPESLGMSFVEDEVSTQR